MIGVVEAHSGRTAATGQGRMIDRVRALHVPAGVWFGVFALAESIARSAVTGVSVQRALVLCLVALATTVPATWMARQPAALVAGLCCRGVAGAVSHPHRRRGRRPAVRPLPAGGFGPPADGGGGRRRVPAVRIPPARAGSTGSEWIRGGVLLLLLRPSRPRPRWRASPGASAARPSVRTPPGRQSPRNSAPTSTRSRKTWKTPRSTISRTCSLPTCSSLTGTPSNVVGKDVVVGAVG